MKTALDFIIVGAQKCATTTLHKYLSEHPDLYLPAGKEAPFFNKPDANAESYQTYLQQEFTDAKPHQLTGKATPQYMSGPDIPSCIKSLSPSTRIIAVLKDPRKRAFSQYRMALRRGTESRSFEQAISAALAEESLHIGRSETAPTHAKGYVSEADFYVPWGEYGRILSRYVQLFESNKILVIFTDELEQQPEQTLDKIMGFLGLETGFKPASLGEKFHVGGGKARINPAIIRNIITGPILGGIYSLIPERLKNTLRYWFEQKNVVVSNAEATLSEATAAKLAELYSKDAALLTAMGYEPPWQLN